ncbi:hypothetical protein CRM22_008173 [Opisthorchis felineus]|uniref:Uncharacterized protein n=1 Tax=Opisthorchis felineus TaxID=147828 RepID=A0A4S2LEK5_OPIFE|nr:hypothetical protein CRM22_008173 [Opisthorchis felineus]
MQRSGSGQQIRALTTEPTCFMPSTIILRPFLGPNKEEAFRQESLNFADSLRTIGLRYQTEPYFWVIPDPPNEPTENLQVWFLVEEP